VVISSQIGYLIGVLRVARTLWHLDVALKGAIEAREALSKLRLVGKSKRSERRVSDAEIRQLLGYFDTKVYESSVPMADIVRFLVATTIRIREVCWIAWDRKDVRSVVGPFLERQIKPVPRALRRNWASLASLVWRHSRSCYCPELRFIQLGVQPTSLH
jgi:hypothetical protein